MNICRYWIRKDCESCKLVTKQEGQTAKDLEKSATENNVINVI